MGIGKRIDGNLEIAFEGTAIRADVEFDVVDGGGHELGKV